MRRFVPALLLAAMLAPAASAQTAPAAPVNCTLKVRASLDMDLDDTGRAIIPVSFNGRPFRMMLDTGDYYSVMTERAAKELGVPIQMSTNFWLTGWGGRTIYKATKVDEFAIGKMKSKDTTFMVDDAYGMADGLLGADFLYYFDLDFDFAKAKLDLISPDHCPGHVISWTDGPFASVPFDYKSRQILLNITLDGKVIPALLDTGAHDTVMSLEEVADLFGLKEEELLKKRDRYTFKQLSFGGVSVMNPTVRLVPDKESMVMGSRGPKMILGMTVLRRLHLYISYKEQMVYATPALQY